MTTIASLRERYLEVQERIARSAERSGRRGDDVLLVAVTKYAEPEQIRELAQLGHVDFGENKVQQLLQRSAVMDEWLARQRVMGGAARAAGGGGAGAVPGGPGIGGRSRGKGAGEGAAAGRGEGGEGGVRWHMIGHLQRNKVRKVVEVARLIHSVDSLRLAEEIQAVAAKRDQVVDVLLQVNTSGEASKFGCAVAAARHLAEQIDTMIQVRLRGLMTMAPLSEQAEDSRRTFSRLRELYEEIRADGVGMTDGRSGHFNILSMGMSGDYEVAIEEGANMVRVGSAIFGDPPAGMVEGEGDEGE